MTVVINLPLSPLMSHYDTYRLLTQVGTALVGRLICTYGFPCGGRIEAIARSSTDRTKYQISSDRNLLKIYENTVTPRMGLSVKCISYVLPSLSSYVQTACNFGFILLLHEDAGHDNRRIPDTLYSGTVAMAQYFSCGTPLTIYGIPCFSRTTLQTFVIEAVVAF